MPSQIPLLGESPLVRDDGGGSRHSDLPIDTTSLDLASAWSICADIYCQMVRGRPTIPSQTEFERELLFCLLGGFGVSFELALSASETLIQLEPFGPHWSDCDLAERIRLELSKRQFQPRTSNGFLRRYRFPQRRADLLVSARRWLISEGAVSQTLWRLGSENERRRLLCQCPGLGHKSASWLLRNLGLASQLAILDIHVVRALRSAGRITNEQLPRDYVSVEAAFLQWCNDLGAPPAAFDLFVWDWQRGSLGWRT